MWNMTLFLVRAVSIEDVTQNLPSPLCNHVNPEKTET